MNIWLYGLSFLVGWTSKFEILTIISKQRSPYYHIIKIFSNVLFSFWRGFILTEIIIAMPLYLLVILILWCMLFSAIALLHLKRTRKWNLWETRKDFFFWRYSIYWLISCPFWVTWMYRNMYIKDHLSSTFFNVHGV